MTKTNAEYMSGQERVERTVQRFITTTLKELRDINAKCIDFINEEVENNESLSHEKALNMPYIEFACLIDHVGGNHNYDWSNHNSFSERQFYYKCISGVLLDNKATIPVRMFTALPLKAFYEYLISMADAEGQVHLQMQFKYIRQCCQYREDYTIKDFLAEKTKALNKVWTPIESIRIYEHTIRTAYQDIGRLLVNSFRYAFPDSFRAKDICDKYYGMAEEDEIESESAW